MRLLSKATEPKENIKPVAVAPGRAFCVFLFGGIGIVVLEVMGFAAWDIFWTDIAQHNPSRSIAHAVLILPFIAILAGIYLSVVNLGGIFIVAALVAAAAVRYFGRFPLWLFTVFLPACVLIVYAKETLLPTYVSYNYIPDESHGDLTALDFTISYSATLAPALIGSWLLLRFGGRHIAKSIRA